MSALPLTRYNGLLPKKDNLPGTLAKKKKKKKKKKKFKQNPYDIHVFTEPPPHHRLGMTKSISYAGFT